MTPKEKKEMHELRAEVAILKGTRRTIARGYAKSQARSIKLIDTLAAALNTEVAILQEYSRGTTHWEGCESDHRACAAIKRMQAALAVGHET